MQTSTLRHNASDIHWYCELRGSGPSVVLIPSGEGDCGSFAKVADELAKDFNVLTFDMPGFSRSSAPPEFGRVTADELADQVASLVTSLNLAPASFYGCSSAGLGRGIATSGGTGADCPMRTGGGGAPRPAGGCASTVVDRAL